jgi:hypothetical protein
MPALTPTSKEVTVSGNKVFIFGTFSSAADTDTWTPGLSTITGAWVTNGDNDVAYGLTFSATVITIQTAGAMANVKIMAVGT